jgi:hypothetical protein
MASTKTSRVNPKYKRKYRVKNWVAFERGLRDRGDITVWFSEEAVGTWTPPPSGCRGGQRPYSNLAVLAALSLRMVFHLPLRQTEGFVASLLLLVGLDLKAPDHSTLCRRRKDVEVPALCRPHDGPIHLLVDSTGLKTYGAGEWCSRKHRKAKERSGWRKMHIGVDDDGFVVAEELTESKADDANVAPDLLEQIETKVGRFTGDGAFDKQKVYEAVGAAGTEDVVIGVPPGRRAKPSPKATGPWAQRNGHLERISAVGRLAWQKETGYRQQARAEGAIGRYKRIIGSSLRARGLEAQQREARIGCAVLNRMLELGKPASYAIAA